MTNIIIDNAVRIENPGRTAALNLIAKYTVPNPDYYRLERMGKWTGNTPEYLSLWQRDGQTLILPSGALEDAKKILTECGATFDISDHRTQGNGWTIDYRSKVNLYEYQERAAEAALRAENGVIVAPCGSGKTQIGLEIAARLGLKTLWLTHTHELLNQSMGRAKACFDLPPQAYGTITAGKVEIGEVITFATVQTMAKLDLTQYKDIWGCVVVDEAHHVAGSPTKVMQFSKVIGNLNARYKFGLTATPKRADGLIACMYAYIGPKVYEISREDVGDKTCPVKYTFVDTDWDCDIDDVTNPDGTLDYVKLINLVCADKWRNFKVGITINKLLQNKNNRVLVLSDRVRHLDDLLSELMSVDKHSVLSGSTRKPEREMALEKLRSGERPVLFATYQLAKEGLDIPELTHVVLASPNKTDTVITQAVGRVARTCEGKQFGTVIDFTDSFVPLKSWARKRERIYKKLNYEPC